MKVVGLMSGTSMDGVDAVLMELEGEGAESFEWTLLAFHTVPYEDARRREIRNGVEGGGPRTLALLHVRLGEWLAEAVDALLEGAGVASTAVRVVGSHGQTIWHEPPDPTAQPPDSPAPRGGAPDDASGRGVPSGRGASLQLGDPATLAERTGIDVVSDFRARDVAAGGHGAPLVPFADRLLFSRPDRSRALQNLGGMGNVTWLPPRGSEEATVAFDTGPGVALLDAAAEAATGGRLRYDAEGELARRGSVDAGLLERLLDHPFFGEAPPRSTGREIFGASLVAELAAERGLEEGTEEEGWDDLLATLTALTVRSVADAYERWVLPLGVDEVVLTGGGARNPALVEGIRDALAPVPVRTGEEALGLDPDAREAAAFAVLAWAHVHGVCANVPAATGARGSRVLGSLTPGWRGEG